MPSRRPARRAVLIAAAFILLATPLGLRAQDDDYADEEDPIKPPKSQDRCVGVFLTYDFINREKEYPRLKNASAQPWSFRSRASVLNTMTQDLKDWKMFIRFQHREILVSTDGAVIVDGSDFPANVANGTTLSGSAQPDLANSIDTAGDMTQIKVNIDIRGTQFGVKPPATPMPRSIKLVNDGFKCPGSTRKGSQMYVCCVKDPKAKKNKTEPVLTRTKFLKRRYGDLTFAYDVLQAWGSNYLAQVTIDNNHPMGRLDDWQLSWEWKRGEFIESMRGAYTLRKDSSDCYYTEIGNFYRDMEFSNIMNCQRRPVIVDLPPERAKDDIIGNIPYCCRNGTLLPNTMDPSQSRSIFQLKVYKMPPDLENRTSFSPPQKWKITGLLNPQYRCGPPFRVRPMEFPDSSGLLTTSEAIASWQVVCNITRPEPRSSGCCVSYSAFYNDSVVPCNTCACGCEGEDETLCNPNGRPLLLPPEALLVPFANRSAKARAWAKINHFRFPKRLPCGDNCGVSINWHLIGNFRSGWTARITMFNWEEHAFKDWFLAVEMDKAYRGYENAYSFNATKLKGPGSLNKTIFMQGLPGLNYLVALTDGKYPATDPRVPGKQQSVISFSKSPTPGINVVKGGGFPTRVFFNGEECALPNALPKPSGAPPPPHRGISRLAFVLISLTVALLLPTSH